MDLFELSATLRMDTSEYERAISKAEKMASDLDKKLGKAGGFSGASVGSGSGIIGRIGSGLGKLASVGTKAFSGMANVGMKSMSMLAKGGQVAFSGLTKGIGMVTKAATIGMGSVAALGAAFAPMVKGAVIAFSSYEQLVGGIETLFNDSAGFVLHDANEAFKTAGMSANQYMENVTSFAASMIQGLGGDTMKAAEMSNMAITDMADNVNKMGTSMESVEYAYRGFSKQNYTMLDNLKLGYGGTRAEMERLLSDAEKLTGKKYDISNFADVVDAIHAIQVEMGITGTTAKEAETTIQGSASRMKASWQNVLTVLANPRGIKNLKAVAQEFGESLTVYISNLAPAIKAAVMGLPTLITELSPVIEEQIPNLISDIIPTIINSGIDLGIALVKGITKTLKKIDFGKIFKTAGSKIKTVATDWLGLPSDASISEIMASLGTKIRKGLKAAKDKAKIALANLIGLTNDDGTPITDVSQIDGRAFVIALVAKIKEGIGAAVVGLLNLIGIVGEDGNPITGIDDVNWTSIADSIVKAVQNAAKTVTFSLAAFLGLDNPEDATLGQVIQGLLDKAVNGLKFGNTFLKKLLLGDEGYRALQEEIAKENATPGFKPNEARIAATEVGWGAVVDNLFAKIKDGFEGKKFFGDLVDIGTDVLKGAIAGVIDFATLIKDNASDIASAIGTVIDSLFGDLGADTTFSQTLSELVTAIIGFAHDFLTFLGFFDSEGNFKLPGWLETGIHFIEAILQTIAAILDGSWIEKIGDALGKKLFGEEKWAELNATVQREGTKKTATSDNNTDTVNDILTQIANSAFGANMAEANLNGIGGSNLNAQSLLFGKSGIFPTWSEPYKYLGELYDQLMEAKNSGDIEAYARIADTMLVFKKEYNSGKSGEEATTAAKEYNQQVLDMMEQAADDAVKKVISDTFGVGMDDLNEASRQNDVGRAINLPDTGVIRYRNGNGGTARRFIPEGDTVTGWKNLVGIIEKILGRTLAKEEIAGLMDKGLRTNDELDNAELDVANATVDGNTVVVNGVKWTINLGKWGFGESTNLNNNEIDTAPHAKGLWSVPYNGYIAMLHRNERVLTASQARQSDYGGGNADVVAAIQSLKNDLQNLKLVVGQKIFGSAVVDYGGKRMNNYIGKAEDKMVAGYGWG